MNTFRCLFTWALVLPWGPVACGQALLGNSFDGFLYDISVATGAATNPRPTGTGVDSLVGIDFAPDGTLYGLTTFVGMPPNALVTIDPMLGTATTVGLTGLFNIAEGDLAFDPTTGTLLGLQNVPANRQLLTLDVATGAATVVGDLGGLTDLEPSAMAFGADGTLYVLETGAATSGPSTLLTVDKSTAAVTSSVTLSVDFGFTAGMDFHPVTGELYIADGGSREGADSLYLINPSTGATTLIGPTGLPDGLAGLAFVIPEPSCLGLALLGSVIGFANRRGGGSDIEALAW